VPAPRCGARLAALAECIACASPVLSGTFTRLISQHCTGIASLLPRPDTRAADRRAIDDAAALVSAVEMIDQHLALPTDATRVGRIKIRPRLLVTPVWIHNFSAVKMVDIDANVVTFWVGSARRTVVPSERRSKGAVAALLTRRICAIAVKVRPTFRVGRCRVRTRCEGTFIQTFETCPCKARKCMLRR